MLLDDNEAYSVRNVPQPVTFCINQTFSFSVRGSTFCRRITQQMAQESVVRCCSWDALMCRGNDSGNLALEYFLVWFELLYAKHSSFLEIHQLIEVCGDRSATRQKMVPSVRKWSNGHSWLLLLLHLSACLICFKYNNYLVVPFIYTFISRDIFQFSSHKIGLNQGKHYELSYFADPDKGESECSALTWGIGY